MAASVVVRDLRVVRGRTEALRGVSLEVEPGLVTGLLGPSGSRKTTLMRAVVGVQVVTSGAVSTCSSATASPSPSSLPSRLSSSLSSRSAHSTFRWRAL